jgi:hypothetical protein
MAAKKRSAKKKSAAKRKRKSRAARGTSPLARMAKAKGMTIAELRKSVSSCGKWSVRRRPSTRKNPCR